MEPVNENKTDEQIARERVEKSPLRFFTIGHYSGNHVNRTSNTIPKPANVRFSRHTGIHDSGILDE